MKPSEVLRMPTDWKQNFRSASMKIGFTLHLTKTMLEFLCAVADNVAWDRSLYHRGMAENWIATSAALFKRGLIESKSQEEIDKEINNRKNDDFKTGIAYEWNHWQLSPAGKCVVELVKLAGMFVEADASINKKNRKKA